MTESVPEGSERRSCDEPETIELVRWSGSWDKDDPDANFKSDVAAYCNADPMITVRGLAESMGLPSGAVARYILAKYATAGSAGVLELGPTMLERLWSPIARAEDTDDDRERLHAYRELLQVLSWLRAPVIDPLLARSSYPGGGSEPLQHGQMQADDG